jgi:hypothetical protein
MLSSRGVREALSGGHTAVVEWWSGVRQLEREGAPFARGGTRARLNRLDRLRVDEPHPGTRVEDTASDPLYSLNSLP